MKEMDQNLLINLILPLLFSTNDNFYICNGIDTIKLDIDYDTNNVKLTWKISNNVQLKRLISVIKSSKYFKNVYYSKIVDLTANFKIQNDDEKYLHIIDKQLFGLLPNKVKQQILMFNHYNKCVTDLLFKL